MITGMSVRHGLSFGRMRMWGSAGFALVSILGGYLWTQVGYNPMFGIAILLALPVIFLSGKLESGPVVNSQTRTAITDLLRDPGLVTLFVVSFLMGAAMLSTYIFGGIYMASLGGSESMMGLMFGLSALVEVPVMHYSGNIIDRLTSTHTLWLSLLILTLSIFGFVLSSTPAMLVMTGLVKGVGFGLFAVTLVRLIDERSPDEWKSTAQAISSVCLFGLSMLLTSALFGYLFDNFGGVTMYGVATMMGITAVILMGVAIFKNWFVPL
jgi:MFS family permease